MDQRLGIGKIIALTNRVRTGRAATTSSTEADGWSRTRGGGVSVAIQLPATTRRAHYFRYSPKSGLRFSLKARTPSFDSSVP